MGFVPLAYRAGSEKKSRVHIFWQKRIRAGDETTPWWFPAKTSGGSIREDRIVLPIPPGTHWSDAKPLILPALSAVGGPSEPVAHAKALPEESRRAAKKREKVETPPPVLRNGLMFSIPKPGEPLPEDKSAKQPRPKPEKIKRTCDPRLVSAAPELRDRYLEHLAADRSAALLPARGKYDVSRALTSGASALKQLPVSEAA